MTKIFSSFVFAITFTLTVVACDDYKKQDGGVGVLPMISELMSLFRIWTKTKTS